jgi:hypothetical protein
MVVQAYNPRYSAKIRRIMVQGQPGPKKKKKFSETAPISNELGVVVLACNPSYMGGTGSRIRIQYQP